MNRLRTWAVVLALALSPACLQAQFTGIVQPPGRRATATTDSAALRASADSARGTASQQMHAWLDSVNRELGIDTVRHTEPNFFARADSSRPVTTEPSAPAPAEPRRGAEATGRVARDEGGMRAPDTATPLPTVALLGVGAMALGFILLRRRPAGASQCAGRSDRR